VQSQVWFKCAVNHSYPLDVAGFMHLNPSTKVSPELDSRGNFAQ
jgi:hypothetical protein